MYSLLLLKGIKMQKNVLKTRLFKIIIILLLLLIFLGAMYNFFSSRTAIESSLIHKVQHFLVSKGEYSNKISMKWRPNSDVDYYFIYRAEGKNAFKLYKADYKNNSFEDKNVKNGKDYFYKIQSHKDNLKSRFSDIKRGFSAVDTTKLIASNGSMDAGIKVTWKPVEKIDYYALFRLKEGGKHWQEIAGFLTQAMYIDEDVIGGENYYYKVKIKQNDKWGKFSHFDRGFVKLASPLGIKAKENSSHTAIVVSWKKVKDTKYYQLYRSLSRDGTFVRIKNKVLQTKAHDSDVIVGKNYYYKVKAINRLSGKMSNFVRAHISIATPKHLMATDASKGKIYISWEAKEGMLFDLYRSVYKDKEFKKVVKNLKTDFFKDETILVAKDYYYKVKAKKGGFESAFSKVDKGYVLVDFPAAVQATDAASAYYIDVSWRSKKVDYFKLFRSDKAQGPFRLIADNLVSPVFRDKDISYCKNYYYKVQSSKNEKLSRLSSLESGYGKCGAFVSTFSGTGMIGSKDDSQKIKAYYNRPTGLAFWKSNLYIADTYNHKIRLVNAYAQTLTFAGSGLVGSEDNVKDKASFYRPTGIVVDKQGVIYIAETDNHIIRRVSNEGKVTTYAGTGHKGDKDGAADKAQFNKPFNLVLDGDGNLFVTELGNHKVRKISVNKMVSTFSGNGKAGKVDGIKTQSQFNQPRGIVMDEKGFIYVADSNNNCIRQIDSTGFVRSFAGGGRKGDVDGKGVSASFNDPRALAMDSVGNIYVADTGNHKIRMITSEGLVKTIAGSSKGGDKDGFESEAAFFSPRGIAIDGNDYIYVSDFHAHKIRKITIMSKEASYHE